MIWLTAAWAWLKKYWQWLVLPVGACLWLLGRLTATKTVSVESGAVVGHDLEQASEDAKAAQAQAQAQVTEVAKLQQIDSGHSAAVSGMALSQQAEIDAARQDPDKVNAVLLNVGKDVRNGL